MNSGSFCVYIFPSIVAKNAISPKIFEHNIQRPLIHFMQRKEYYPTFIGQHHLTHEYKPQFLIDVNIIEMAY